MRQQMSVFSAQIASRREVILEAWRNAVEADPAQTTVSALTRSQFNDHIPALLDAFEEKLRADPGGQPALAANQAKVQQEIKHGLQRWQQGYRLNELVPEWGHLHRCLSREIHFFAATHPTVGHATLLAAHDELADLVSEGVNQSVCEYARMQQGEAAGHVKDLQLALEKLHEIEKARVTLIRQVVHDLRSNVQSVKTAADLLKEKEIAENERVGFAGLVQKELETVSSMLEDLMTLARLEAGQDKRTIASFDPAKMLTELTAVHRQAALARGLYLRAEGPVAFIVQGDRDKAHRIVQNILGNALKYTTQGGIRVTWGENELNWSVSVSDTGPGLMNAPSAPIATAMVEATASAREDGNSGEQSGGGVPVGSIAPRGPVPPPQSRSSQSGEGVGLSIVKRLCELLDASLELTSSPETGTTFQVTFPRHYPQNKDTLQP